MKLLLDQNLSYRLAKRLQTHFPDSQHVKHVGLMNCNDIDILRYAQKHSYVIVTQDEDFYELSLDQSAIPKIVWLRCGNLPSSQMLELLLSHQPDIEKLIAEQEAWCLEIN